jgi:hypothetical protein
MTVLTANNPLMVTIKNVYGTEMIYPANSVAQIFADIARQKTLSRETLKLAKALGYEIQVQQQKLAWSTDNVLGESVAANWARTGTAS